MVLAFSHHFSIEEARLFVPWVEEQLAQLQQLRMALREGIRELTAITDHLLPTSFPSGFFQLLGLMRAFEERGIVLRDPALGVVHFPHLLPGGEEVVLCYQRGDGWPRFYHSPEGSFSDRTLLLL